MCGSQTQANLLRLHYQLMSFSEDEVHHTTISSLFCEEKENEFLRLRTQVSKDIENNQSPSLS